MIAAIFESTWSRVAGWMGLHDIATISAFRKELKDVHSNIPGGMEIGGVEHLVSKVTEEHPTREVAVERFGHKPIFSDFVHDPLFCAANVRNKPQKHGTD